MAKTSSPNTYISNPKTAAKKGLAPTVKIYKKK